MPLTYDTNKQIYGLNLHYMHTHKREHAHTHTHNYTHIYIYSHTLSPSFSFNLIEAVVGLYFLYSLSVHVLGLVGGLETGFGGR